MRLATLAAAFNNQCVNMIRSRSGRPHSRLLYVIESAGWSVKWDGQYITGNLNHQKLIRARVTAVSPGILGGG